MKPKPEGSRKTLLAKIPKEIAPNKTIFLDTNVFIECKSLEQLQWAEIANSTNMELLVPQTVVWEIDKLKAGPQG